MLDIEELNKKMNELYEQDTILINQSHDSFVRINKIIDRLEALETAMKEQTARIRELTGETQVRKLYRVVWKTGHAQLVFAYSTDEARTMAERDFSGSDKIVDVFVNQSREW